MVPENKRRLDDACQTMSRVRLAKRKQTYVRRPHTAVHPRSRSLFLPHLSQILRGNTPEHEWTRRARQYRRRGERSALGVRRRETAAIFALLQWQVSRTQAANCIFGLLPAIFVVLDSLSPTLCSFFERESRALLRKSFALLDLKSFLVCRRAVKTVTVSLSALIKTATRRR